MKDNWKALYEAMNVISEKDKENRILKQTHKKQLDELEKEIQVMIEGPKHCIRP